MFRVNYLLVFMMALVGGMAQSDDQSDAEIKARVESSRVRTLSYVDTKLEVEFVYDVDAATAKKLPRGDLKNLSANQANALEDIISEIRKQEPKKVVPIQKDKERATTATHNCYWYSSPYSHYSYYSPVYYGGGWYSGGYYGGGGFYGSGYYGYATVWPYYGCYSSYYSYPSYYWGY